MRITYEAVADATTACSITNHAYWNLAGPTRWSDDGAIGDHELRVPSERVQPADDRSLPIGPLATVEGTELDLRHARPLGEVLDDRPAGLDHSYAVSEDPEPATAGSGLHLAAELHHPASGRTVTVATDQPALHVYTANRLGGPFGRRAASASRPSASPARPTGRPSGRRCSTRASASTPPPSSRSARAERGASAGAQSPVVREDTAAWPSASGASPMS
ncbi:MAG: hypothetical protein R2711_10485 [Acidimicrobiales bacterium]